MMGNVAGRRFEQLLRGSGTLRVGKVWQTAVFPSGSAFGYIVAAPDADGSPSYNEGFVYVDGQMRPAQVVEAPWLRKLDCPQQVPVVLATDTGEVRIDGETIASNFYPYNPTRTWTQSVLSYEMATARYRWNGEETYNMIERSALPEQIQS